MKCLLATILALHSAAVAAQGKCDHYLDQDCVDAFGSVSFEFQPLFSSAPRFAYGFRVYFEGEISSTLVGHPLNYRGDTNEAKMWLEYANETLNIDTSANRTTHFATLLTNATGTVSGGSNGCEGLLGADCVNNLKDVLKWAVVLSPDYQRNVFDNNVGKFQTTPLTNLSCPAGIFDHYQSMLNRGVVDEYPYDIYMWLKAQPPKPSGNASYPWTTDLMYHSAEEYMAWAAIGIIARYPNYTPRNYDDIQLELVCLRPTAVEGSGDRIDTSKVTIVPSAAGPTSTGGSQPDGADNLRKVNSLLLVVLAIIGGAFRLV